MRKTISIENLRNIVNRRNRFSGCSVETRQGWNSLLVEALQKTGNYKGFDYLNDNLVPKDSKPGIRGNTGNTTKERFHNTDSTRIFYF